MITLPILPYLNAISFPNHNTSHKTSLNSQTNNHNKNHSY